MNDELTIQNPTQMYRNLNKALVGLEEHGDVDGAIKNIEAAMARLDGVRRGEELEAWFESLLQYENVETIAASTGDAIITVFNTTPEIPGELLGAVMNTAPDGVELESISFGADTSGEVGYICLEYPYEWHLGKGVLYNHSPAARALREGAE